MTDAELEELEVLLAAPNIEPLPWIRVDDWVAVPDGCDWKYRHVCEVFFPDVAHGDLIAKGISALPSLISTIRELREENAARDRVVEAARLAKSQWEESALSDFWCFPEELSSALAALEEAKP